MTHPAVRAKFFVVEVTHRVNVTSIKLGAVCRGEDNKEWASATPSGTITMDVLSAAGGVFKPGDEFFIDFVPAPKGKPGRTDAADDA